ncbi:hypothetical protein GCM10027343_42700 [Noviherbaspirillum agri]
MDYDEISAKLHRARYGRRLVLCAFALSFALFGAGCATTDSGAEVDRNAMGTLLQDAENQLAAGQHEKAIDVLSDAAKKHPTSALPWLKTANIWFEKGNYPSTIFAANEALQRDSGNQEAKSLLVVAGLRVAAGAVTELRPTSSVNATTRVEAENLTNSLRSALGEKVLVPSAAGKAGRPAPRPKRRAAVPAQRSDQADATVPVAAAIKQAAPDITSSDPFKSLK